MRFAYLSREIGGAGIAIGHYPTIRKERMRTLLIGAAIGMQALIDILVMLDYVTH